MPLSSGTRFGPYEITALLGAGGMGEVYRARDPKLGRDVALKVLSPALARDADYMARFTREAQVLASLNHPNIAAIYGLEESSGIRALVMELVEGRTLAERIAAGPLPMDEALAIARQIAEALEAAHEKGITHRDLKPANVKITPAGVVKVLDFGLAKLAEPVAVTSADSPTLTMRATQAGIIMGTAAYMSPEQARGMPVDKRTDIWAYGVVLFEMLTGREMFPGETFSDTLAAVLRADLDWSALSPSTPPPIQRLLRRCVQRDRKKRLADIADARLEIDDALAGAQLEQGAAPVATHRTLPWAVAAVVAGAIAASLLHFHQSPPEQPILKFSIAPPEGATFGSIAISPNGRRLAFTAIESGKSQLWVRPLDSLIAQPMANTDSASYLFWSPDSRFIGFFADGKLKKIEASGGPTLTLCDAPNGRGGAWSHDGVIVFSGPGIPLTRVAAEGGAATPDTSLRENRRWPVFLPDGRHYLYTMSGGIYVGALDSRETTLLLPDTSSTAYAAIDGAGYLLFWRGGNIMAQPFDSGNLRLSAGPFPVAERVGYSPSSYLASFSASENGVLVYDSAHLQRDQLAWFDRTGKRLGTVGEPRRYYQPALSPDEKQVAVDRLDPPGTEDDLWLIDLAGGISTRFTFDPKDDAAPVWSPDGRSIAFASNREGVYDLYLKISSGAGKEELLLKSGNVKRTSDWSPDGRFILYHEQNLKTKYGLWLLPFSGDRKPLPFLQTEFNETHGAFAPDGKSIAYQSDESGKYEVYVQTFPATGAKWQISKAGGTHPRWRGDGKELFYQGADRMMMAVALRRNGTLQVDVPHPLFDTHITNSLVRFAVTRDGQRFLIPTPISEASATPATVVLNWTAGIKR